MRNDRERQRRDERNSGEYNSGEYYRPNRELGDLRDINRGDEAGFDGFYSDIAGNYDELNTGKYENYAGQGYYGSNYGAINSSNSGPDYEQNAGYRERYNRIAFDDGYRAQREDGARTQEGPHRGKGPKSYQRSDARITEEISDRLADDRYVDASDIEVRVEKGEVVLEGTVRDRMMKRRAEDVIESISGVKHVENRLKSSAR